MCLDAELGVWETWLAIVPGDSPGICAYFEHVAETHEPVSSPRGEGQGEGASVRLWSFWTERTVGKVRR